MSQHPSVSRGAGDATLEREAATGKPPILPLNSAELSSSFHKLISFSLNANLVILLCKVFPLTAPAAFLPPHQFFPVTILDPVQGGLAAVLPPDRITWTVRGKMPGNFNTSGKSDLEHPRHTLLFSYLYFPWWKAQLYPPTLSWAGDRAENLQMQNYFKKYNYF